MSDTVRLHANVPEGSKRLSPELTAQIIEGISPEVAFTIVADGILMTVTTKSGKKTVLIPQGPQGLQGLQGPQGEPGDATIDDTAGEGDVTKVWSADKSASENQALSSAIQDKYELPPGGIPATDIAEGVIPSIDPQDIANAVEDWLDDHPEATTTVQDGSISKSKLDTYLNSAVFDEENSGVINLINGTTRTTQTVNDVTYEWDESKRVCHVTGTATGVAMYNFITNYSKPDWMVPGQTYYATCAGATNVHFLIYSAKDTTLTQLVDITYGSAEFTIPSDATGMIIRFRVLKNSATGENVRVGIYSAKYPANVQYGGFINHGIITTGRNINYMKDPGSYLLLSTNTYTNAPPNVGANGKSAIMFVIKADKNFMLQIATTLSAGDNAYYMRVIRVSDYFVIRDWTDYSFPNNKILPASTDVSTVTAPGMYLLSAGNYVNLPSGVTTAMMLVFKCDNWTWQMLYEIYPTSGRIFTQSIRNSGAVLREWEKFSGGNVYNITQEINRDTISNTYNATVSPVITTDSNGWLQPTGDQTDRTTAIMAMLNSTGYCHLAPGDFWVSGNIDMPDGAIIEGCGEKTVLHLLNSVSSGYILQVKNHNTVRSIKFSGGNDLPTNLYSDDTTYGSRHGIIYIGNADGQESAHSGTHETSIITDCFFEYFDGSAIYGRNVGGGLQQGLRVSTCVVYYSRVGINLDYNVEYCAFSDCLMWRCHWACINNGGNNIFTACTFHGVVGFLIDDSNNDKGNNSHGSCVGCIFNHIDNMQQTLGGGLAIHTINADFGFIFTGCQLWYGNVLIENSKGITISNSLFGNSAVEIEATGQPVFFIGNMFYAAPTTLTVTAGSKFANNYTVSGTEVKTLT